MSLIRLDRLMEFLANIELAMATLWLGLAIFTVGLAILMYTRWGQFRPLRKCMAMSLLAHLLLAGYAATVEIITPAPPSERVMLLVLGDGPDEDAASGGAGPPPATVNDQPWEVFPGGAPPQPEQTPLERGAADHPVEPQRLLGADQPNLSDNPDVDRVGQPDAMPVALKALRLSSPVESPEPIEAPPAQRRDAALPTTASDAASAEGLVNAAQTVPDAYRLRVAPDRASVAQSHGGTSETEAAVKAALRWLADNQSGDGRWDPRIHAAGREGNVLGKNHQGAGSRADSAMTGLALLSFLGSGHTHLEGPYRHDVGRGLEYLLQTQAPDGNLAGHAAVFESMYCHAMAACALSEAYGLTRDRRLREPVRRAVGFTIAAQDPKGGGWRYRPGDAGDTSQLGWQLMSLKSAELAGIPMPEQTRQGVVRYLQSVASGVYGGLASYRPGEQTTRTMTAEALVCWQFLGLGREHPACREASECLVGEVPGEGAYNLYYWYYATLGMYQLQDANWPRWNESVRAALVSRQVKEGPMAGSWDTTDLWGGHGGRVYTTALATLTLEVYYRFLPIYVGVSPNTDRRK